MVVVAAAVGLDAVDLHGLVTQGGEVTGGGIVVLVVLGVVVGIGRRSIGTAGGGGGGGVTNVQGAGGSREKIDGEVGI